MIHKMHFHSKAHIMEATKVGIREFRAGMAEFIASSTPVAVTRHGQTIGYFIPTHGEVEADIASLKKASKTLDRLLAAKSLDVDGVVAEFKTARKRSSTPKQPAPVMA
jgi:hypothetical protein